MFTVTIGRRWMHGFSSYKYVLFNFKDIGVCFLGLIMNEGKIEKISHKYINILSCSIVHVDDGKSSSSLFFMAY